MLRWLTVVGLCHGCALAWHDSHRSAPPISSSECPSRTRALIDTVGAVGLGAMTGEAYVHRNDADSAAFIWVAPLAIGVAAFTASAVYGFIEPGVCERTVADQQRIQLEAAQRDERDRARFQARVQASARLRAAAEAARRGDCESVRAASDDVLAIDREFHAVVFVRDVAIARCLGPPR